MFPLPVSDTRFQSTPPPLVCKHCGTTDHKLIAYGQDYIKNSCRMILLQRSLITTLPEDFIKQIFSFCNQNTLLRLSETARRTKYISDFVRKKLTISVPSGIDLWSVDKIKTINPSIFENLLKRFENLTHLVSAIYIDLFSELECHKIFPAFFFPAFFHFLKSHYPPHLRHVTIQELQTNPTELTEKYLDALIHPQLISIDFRKKYIYTVMTDVMINLALKKTKDLVSCTFNGFLNNQKLDICFSHCPKLETIRLNWMDIITSKTIEQLGYCSNLTELSISRTSKGRMELEQFLRTNHKLKLKVLYL